MMKERGTYLVPTLLAGEYAAGRAEIRHYPPEIAAKARAAVAAPLGDVPQRRAAGGEDRLRHRLGGLARTASTPRSSP